MYRSKECANLQTLSIVTNFDIPGLFALSFSFCFQISFLQRCLHCWKRHAKQFCYRSIFVLNLLAKNHSAIKVFFSTRQIEVTVEVLKAYNAFNRTLNQKSQNSEGNVLLDSNNYSSWRLDFQFSVMGCLSSPIDEKPRLFFRHEEIPMFIRSLTNFSRGYIITPNKTKFFIA